MSSAPMDFGPLEWLFWGSLTLILYTYALFPLFVVLRGYLFPRPYKRRDITPMVSMIIAAHNEEDSLRQKLENALSLDYPKNRLEIVVASDGSTDSTVEIARQFEDRGVQVLDLPRTGKAGALNAAVAASNGEVLVFSDANSMYARDAIHGLVRPLADPTVGGVAGDQTYVDKHLSQSPGEHFYWDFDQMLKRMQSLAGNAISATGAIYSLRRTLFQAVPEGVTDDFATSTEVIARGYRLVFAPDAVAYEPPASSNSAEFGRKVRVMTRGLRAVLYRRSLLNPFRYGMYSLDLLTHKLLRRLMVFPLLLLLPTSVLLGGEAVIYQLAATAQIAFYFCALVGFWMSRRNVRGVKIFSLPFFFCLVYAAAFLATWNLLRGHTVKLWEPAR